jgi:hypothetical protein
MQRQLVVGTGFTLGATLAMGGVAQAACNCTVNSLADPSEPGHTTLRDAITSANLNPGSTITFASGLSGTITLDGTDLPTIAVPTTITGPGAGQITVSGNNATRIFYIQPTNPGDPVSISGLTLSAGNSIFGGGISASYTALTVSDSVISGNNSSSDGGGIAVNGGSLTLIGSTVSGNTGDRGSGVYTDSGSGTPSIIRSSTISGNSGADYGGGVYFDYSSPATLDNTTVYGNRAGTGAGLYHFGAYDGDPGMTVTGSTITHNSAVNRGGGIACYGTTGGGGTHNLTEPILRNTIVFGNTAPAADQGLDVSCDFNNASANGGTVPAAFSLLGSVDPGTTLAQTGPDILGQDPQLGPLQNNGGPTKTQLPADSSPVINKGLAFGLTTDQRGGPRPLGFPGASNAAGGDGSDIGAVEVESNSFTAKLKGKKLIVKVFAPGTVKVSDAKAPLSAQTSKKKKRKVFLKSSSASGNPPKITVPLRLTKLAKKKLRQRGKVGVKARVTFTPKFAASNTKKLKLKVKGKKKK